MNPKDAWLKTLRHLRVQFDRASFDTWLKDITFVDYEASGQTFILGVTSTYVLDMVQKRLYHKIHRTLKDIVDQDIMITFKLIKKQVKDSPAFFDIADEMPLLQHIHDTTLTKANEDNPKQELFKSHENTFNPKFTFDRFLVDPNNLVTYQVVRHVAESPDGRYNPLLIYGDVGLGKTHLLHAIGHEYQKRGLNIVYVSSEVFTNDLILAIRHHKQLDFRNKYRTANVLVVDDVQFLGGKGKHPVRVLSHI